MDMSVFVHQLCHDSGPQRLWLWIVRTQFRKRSLIRAIRGAKHLIAAALHETRSLKPYDEEGMRIDFSFISLSGLPDWGSRCQRDSLSSSSAPGPSRHSKRIQPHFCFPDPNPITKILAQHLVTFAHLKWVSRVRDQVVCSP